MAKVGEGDARWIVQERADGTNVHGWHWQERDVLKWSQTRLTELLSNLVILNGQDQVCINCTTVDSVTGEALINNRKKKLIPSYELAVKGHWKGEIKDGSQNSVASASGSFQLPYISDENADEDPELTVSLTDSGAGQQQLKQAFVTKGKMEVFKAVKQFVKEIQAGGPLQKATDAQPQPDKPTARTAASITSVSTSAPSQSNGAASSSKPKSGTPSKKAADTHTLDFQESFYARAQDIFECFTQAGKIQAYTQSPAQAQPEVGGSFSMFGGSVQGVYRELVPFSNLKLDWRFGNWPDCVMSKVDIKLEEPEQGTTILTLHHTGIPHEDKYGNSDVEGTTRNGWQQLILHRIKAVFGYGL
ncbi:hypothetical protein ABBQ32_000695 [Trebouxia sp. C0010 RCD-2024]